MSKKAVFKTVAVCVLATVTGYKKGMDEFNKLIQTPRLNIRIRNIYTPYNRTSNHPRNT